MTATIQTVPLSQLKPNADNPRTSFDPQRIEALAATILQHGVLQNLVVKRAKGRKVAHIPPILVVNPESVTMCLNFQGVTPMVGQEPRPPSDLGETHGPSRRTDTRKPHHHRRFPR